MYSPKNWSRDQVNVLMRLDETQFNYVNPQYGIAATRPDKDQAIAWAKMYGKGRVVLFQPGPYHRSRDDPDGAEDVPGSGEMGDGAGRKAASPRMPR